MEERALLEWLRDLLGPGTELLESKPLTGGMASTVTRLRVEEESGQTRYLVLRAFSVNWDVQEEVAKSLEHESGVLRFLDGHASSIDASFPRLIAADFETLIRQLTK